MEDLKKVIKSVVGFAARATVLAVEVAATTVEKVIDVAKEVKQNRRMELFIAKEGYKRFVIHKTTNPKFAIYEIYDSQEKIEYQIDGRLTSRNFAVNFVVNDQVVADAYENKLKKKKGLIHDSVSYEFTLEVNNNHYGNINVGFDEGQLKFYLDTNKWETDIKVTDKKVDIIDELDQVVCSIDLKPNVKDMVTIDVKENHNQLLALMYCFVVMAVKEYLDK